MAKNVFGHMGIGPNMTIVWPLLTMDMAFYFHEFAMRLVCVLIPFLYYIINSSQFETTKLKILLFMSISPLKIP